MSLFRVGQHFTGLKLLFQTGLDKPEQTFLAYFKFKPTEVSVITN